MDAIKNDYANDYIYGFGSLPLKENDQNEDVKAMHIMINALRKVYPQITEVGSGSYFTKRSGDAIEELRETFLMKKSRLFDKELYERILVEINSIESINSKYI